MKPGLRGVSWIKSNCFLRAHPEESGGSINTQRRRPVMKILALDLGKFKTVGCEYEAESGRHRFATVLTTPKALHDLIVDREPQRVVIDICSIAGWVSDLVRRSHHPAWQSAGAFVVGGNCLGLSAAQPLGAADFSTHQWWQKISS